MLIEISKPVRATGAMRTLFHVRPVDVWKIHNPLGVWIGNVDTLMLDSTTGAVRLVYASIFEIPGGQIVLPWRTLRLDRLPGVFFTLVTKRRMLDAPDIGAGTLAEDAERILLDHYRECLTPKERVH